MSGLETLIASLAGNEDLGRGESATRMWAVRPILETLGWRFVPDEVVPKDRDDGGSAYYCLRGGGRNLALVDVRRAGADLSVERERTLASAAGEEAPLAVLTDGLTWLFHLPERADGGDPQPFHRADCRGPDAARAAAGLERFLGREALRGGAALEAARAESDRRERARAALDAAWEHMLSDPGGLVRDLLAETAREQSGADPDPEAVSGFLREKLEGGARRPRRRAARRGTRSAPKKAAATPAEALDTSDPAVFKGLRPRAFRLGEVRRAVGSWRELLPAVCGLLAEDDPAAFVERMSRLRGQPYFRLRSQSPDTDHWIEVGRTSRFVYVNITGDKAVERARRVVEAARGPQVAASFLVEAERAPQTKPRTAPPPQRGPDYGGKKPAAYWLDGVRHPAARWIEVLGGVCDRMAEEAGSAFVERVAGLRGTVRPYFSDDPARLHHPLRLEHSNLYVDGKFRADNSVRMARRVIEAVRGPRGADSFRIELAE